MISFLVVIIMLIIFDIEGIGVVFLELYEIKG